MVHVVVNTHCKHVSPNASVVVSFSCQQCKKLKVTSNILPLAVPGCALSTDSKVCQGIAVRRGTLA